MPYATIALIVVAVLSWLMASRRGEARRESGAAIVAYGGPMKGLAIAFLVFPMAIAGLAVVSPPKPEERWIPLYIILGFLAFALPTAIEVFRRRLRIEHEALVSISPWTGQRQISWDEVTNVSYPPLMSWYVIEAHGGRRVRVAALMSGLQTLAETLSSRAPKGLATQAIEQMRSGRKLG